MVYFRRSLFLTLWVIGLVLVLVLGFYLVNLSAEKSGFSSGEVLVFDSGEDSFSGEIFGEKFSFDFSVMEKYIPVLKTAAVFLPPPIKFFIRILYWVL